MTYGVDTTFLVEMEAVESRAHEAASRWLRGALGNDGRLVIAGQVLTEFIHVISDPARFERPLTVSAATDRAEAWWTAREVTPVQPSEASVNVFLDWIPKYHLGRKRLLDTMLAATYFTHGVRDIVTSDARDYSVFGVFQIHRPS
jgi:predicted nucleic acid-binding protein